LKEHKLKKFGNKVTSYLGYYITSSLIFYAGHWNRILKCRELGRTGHMGWAGRGNGLQNFGLESS
jgi:hypothetical protein